VIGFYFGLFLGVFSFNLSLYYLYTHLKEKRVSLRALRHPATVPKKVRRVLSPLHLELAWFELSVIT
jgi:hypothetical protein